MLEISSGFSVAFVFGVLTSFSRRIQASSVRLHWPPEFSIKSPNDWRIFRVLTYLKALGK